MSRKNDEKNENLKQIQKNKNCEEILLNENKEVCIIYIIYNNYYIINLVFSICYRAKIS